MDTQNKNLFLNEEAPKKVLPKPHKVLLGIGAALALIAVGMLFGGLRLTEAQSQAIELVNLKEDYTYWESIRNDAEDHMTQIGTDAAVIRTSLGL